MRDVGEWPRSDSNLAIRKVGVVSITTQAHNLKVAGLNPAPATKIPQEIQHTNAPRGASGIWPARRGATLVLRKSAK